MSVHFGVGGQFLAELAKTGIVSDGDLALILETPDAVEGVAVAMKLQVEEVRRSRAARKRHNGVAVSTLRLPDELKALLLDKDLKRVTHLVDAWPGGLREAGLSLDQIAEVGQELRRLGAISDMPDFGQTGATQEPKDLDK